MATDTWSDSYLSAGGLVYSTYLANQVTTYQRLADRISYALGWPIVNLELHGNQIYTNIAQSVEFFSKYAGYTEEHLVFDSDKYTRGKGLNIAELLTLTPELTATYESTIEVTTKTTTEVATTTAKNFDADSEGTFISLFEFNVGNAAVDPSEYTFTVTLNDSNAQVSKALVIAVSGDTDNSQSADVSLTQYGDVFTTSTEIFEVSSIPGLSSCLLYTSPSPRDGLLSRMPSSA